MRNSLLVILTFLLITILWWLPNIDEMNVIQDQQELTPDFTATYLHQEMYDQDGNIQQEVFSQKMEHYSELSLTHFIKPEFIIYQDDKPHWRLSAKIGNLHEDSLVLDENVIMLQIVDNALVNKITTEFIEINLKTNFVSSDKPIKIEGKNVLIQGMGLTANLNKGNIKLTNHVQTRIN